MKELLHCCYELMDIELLTHASILLTLPVRIIFISKI